MDQRGRDSPPIFYLHPGLTEGKYHVLLTERQRVDFDTIESRTEVTEANQTRQVASETTHSRVYERGLYPFRTIEARDKFIRRLNAASGIDEHPIALAVTLQDS